VTFELGVIEVLDRSLHLRFGIELGHTLAVFHVGVRNVAAAASPTEVLQVLPRAAIRDTCDDDPKVTPPLRRISWSWASGLWVLNPNDEQVVASSTERNGSKSADTQGTGTESCATEPTKSDFEGLSPEARPKKKANTSLPLHFPGYSKDADTLLRMSGAGPRTEADADRTCSCSDRRQRRRHRAHLRT
jgi:hypothetical protein